MSEYKAKAFAKVNLTLDILGKYPNGYHRMDMVMASIGIFDEITISLNDSGAVRSYCMEMPELDSENNITSKCARAFLDRAGKKDGVDIFIHKMSPSQAGLGGGSADGACVLNMLNEIYQKPFSLQELIDMSAPIGADIPFCLVGNVARVGGIGEIVEPVESDLSDIALLVVKPPIGIPTGPAFKAFDTQEKPVHPNTEAMIQCIKEHSLSGISENLYNVMQKANPVPEVEKCIIDLLENGACGAVMSGSGSAVFGIFESDCAAETARNRMQSANPDSLYYTCHFEKEPFEWIQ